MAKRGQGYGSEDHLLSYHEKDRQLLDRYIQSAIGTSEPIQWLYPGAMVSEPKDLSFISFSSSQAEAWKSFWPSPGNRSWDAVAKAGGDWLLFEAKANASELRSPGTGATSRSLATILAAFEETKNHIGVDSKLRWHEQFYQYANRLAALYFMNVVAQIPARLIFIYFTGDAFPDGRACPSCKEEWEPLIAECHRALGLPENHCLSQRVHEVFVPVRETAEGSQQRRRAAVIS